MTNHLLTDELAEDIAQDAQWSSDIGDVVFRHDDMRAAYDMGKSMGEIKGSADMAIKVSNWLRDNVGELLLSAESELSHRYLESLEKEFIQSFVDAVYPQENN